MIMSEKIAVDTNVLIYLHDDTIAFKKQIALEILAEKPVIAAQVISEYLNVLKRLTKEPKLALIEHCLLTVEDCEIVSISYSLIEKAKELIIKYDFQLFDSLIVASALQADCTILYSEDLQHNLLVENRLRIINPFI
jgi:predicted nucleic acid-binding protein